MPLTVTLPDLPQRPGTLVPGSTVRVHITWTLNSPPKSIDAHLVYRTSGKGTQDRVSVASETFEGPQPHGQWDVTLTLPPDAPPSYDGRLLSVTWFVQADAGKHESADVEFVLSPIGRPLTPQRTEK